MFPTTLTAIVSILKTDPTINPQDRANILTAIRNHGEKPKTQDVPQEIRILRRSEVAKRLSISTRGVDRLAKGGVLQRAILPGRSRACGFRSTDIDRLIMEMRSDGS